MYGKNRSKLYKYNQRSKNMYNFTLSINKLCEMPNPQDYE
jgi:hypothetical protein